MNYTEAIDGSSRPSVGACGTALTRGASDRSDIDTDPLWADYRIDSRWRTGCERAGPTDTLLRRRVLGTFANILSRTP